MFVLCTSLLYLSLTLLASGALSQSPVEELKVCQTELKQCLHKLSNVESDTYLGRVCQWVANPNKGGRETLKTTVHNLLHAAQLEHTDHVGDHFELDLVLSMKNSELVALRRFLLTDQGEEKEIQDILKDSFKIRTSNSLKSKR